MQTLRLDIASTLDYSRAMLDALIVGAGPTGLTMASELKRHGLQCQLIDAAPQPPLDASRALAIQARTLEIFEQLDCIATVMRQSGSVHALTVVSGRNHRYTMPLDALSLLETPYPMMRMLPQHVTESVLSERLTAVGGEVRRGVEFVSFVQDADRVIATLRTPNGEERLTARWLLGCDGSRSPVRQAAGIAFDGDTYQDHCMVGDLEVAWELSDSQLYLFPSRRGLVAAFPMPEPRHFRIVAILPHESVAAERALTLEDFSRTLQALLPIPFTVVSARFTSRYRLHHRVAAAFRRERVFLAGDAAHVHSPVGGQGMNTGIQDAFNLAWKLAAVTQQHAPPWVLETYEAERRRVALKLVQVTDRMFGVLAGHGVLSGALRTIAPEVAPRLFRFKGMQRRLLGFFSQLHVRYSYSPYSSEASRVPFAEGAPGPGDRAVDAQLIAPAGHACRLFEVLRGTQHTLLLFAPHNDTAAPEAVRRVQRRIEESFSHALRVVIIARTPGETWYGDSGGAAHTRYGATDGTAVLIRPDGYIAHRCQPIDEERLREALARRIIARDASAQAAPATA